MMEKIKRAYYYLFYKLYKWYEKAPVVWWSEWKAGLSIDVLIFFLLFSGIIYYDIYIDRHFHFVNETVFGILYVVLIVIPNYFIFHHRNQWKDIVKEFDQLPKRTNKIGGGIVFGVILLIIANLIFAFYQMSLIDWSQYR